MSPEQNAIPQRSYGCTFGCGNPYDYVIISVSDGSTEFLCLPCYVRLATYMVRAVTDPNSLAALQEMEAAYAGESAPMTGPGPKRRGKNAPATTTDDDVIDAFNGVVTEDELPDDFR